MSDLYIPNIGPPILLYCFWDLLWEYINHSKIHECRNYERGLAVRFLGKKFPNFSVKRICSAVHRVHDPSAPASHFSKL